MKNHGFIRVAAATIAGKVADCTHNVNEILNTIEVASDRHPHIMVFPELCITSYTCGDLFFQEQLLEEALLGLERIRQHSVTHPIAVIVGLPLMIEQRLYNCVAVVAMGRIVGITPKTYLPNYNEFYEQRWFASASTLKTQKLRLFGFDIPVGTHLLYQNQHLEAFTFAVEICEDLWTPIPPSSHAALAGALVIVNPSASNDLVGKSDYRMSLISNQSARTVSAYVYASAGFGESTTDVVYGGHCLIYENGALLKENQRFSLDTQTIFADVDIERLIADRRHLTTYFHHEDGLDASCQPYTKVLFDTKISDIKLHRYIDPHPFVPSNQHERERRCEEIFSIQTHGLAKRLLHVGSKKVVLGISGGLDSTLALLVCAKAYDLIGFHHEDIIAITMPGFGTTDRTYKNACALTKQLGATLLEIPIAEACNLHFRDIDHDPLIHDVTYENTQARERTQILMDYGNKVGGLVIGTGDLSELALGWATYNGDHMSMYAVNTSVPKTLVRYLVEWVSHVQPEISEILTDVLSTPVSPELLPPDDDGRIAQKTEEVVGPYELHDFFLYYMIRFGFTPTKIFHLAILAFSTDYDRETILKWLKTFYRRFFSQQFKRSCLPDGPKVGSINLSPRGDWRMPSDAVARIWLDALDKL